MIDNKDLFDEIIASSKIFADLVARVQCLEEKLIDYEERKQIPIKEKEYYTFNDIVREFPMSKKTFYKYKKLYNLVPDLKRSRTLYYKKTNVIDFIKSIESTKSDENFYS